MPLPGRIRSCLRDSPFCHPRSRVGALRSSVEPTERNRQFGRSSAYGSNARWRSCFVRSDERHSLDGALNSRRPLAPPAGAARSGVGVKPGCVSAHVHYLIVDSEQNEVRLNAGAVEESLPVPWSREGVGSDRGWQWRPSGAATCALMTVAGPKHDVGASCPRRGQTNTGARVRSARGAQLRHVSDLGKHRGPYAGARPAARLAWRTNSGTGSTTPSSACG